MEAQVDARLQLELLKLDLRRRGRTPYEVVERLAEDTFVAHFVLRQSDVEDVEPRRYFETVNEAHWRRLARIGLAGQLFQKKNISAPSY